MPHTLMSRSRCTLASHLDVTVYHECQDAPHERRQARAHHVVQACTVCLVRGFCLGLSSHAAAGNEGMSGGGRGDKEVRRGGEKGEQGHGRGLRVAGCGSIW